MLSLPAEFPQAGSAAFVKGSADPVTIIRRNADGTALVRCDPRSHEIRNRDATGNRTEDLKNLCATADEAARAGLAKRRAKKGAQ